MADANVQEYFDRFGRLAGEMEDSEDFQSAMRSSIASIHAEYDDADRWMLEKSSKIAEHEALIDTYKQDFVTDAKTLLYETLREFRGLHSDVDLPGAVAMLIAWMKATSETVKAGTPNLGAVSYGAANIGNARLVTRDSYEVSPPDGQLLQNMRHETVKLECIVDAQDSGTTGAETWRARGRDAVPNVSFLFPIGTGNAKDGGSGMDHIFTAAHGGIDETGGPGGNLTKNADFETFTVANTPDNWTFETGAAGVEFFKSTTFARGAASLEIKGTTLSKIRQDLGSLTGSTARVGALKSYTLTVKLRDGAVAPTAGDVRIAVENTAGSTVLREMTIGLASLTSSWSNSETSFIAPVDVPADVVVRVHVNVAMGGATESFLIDEIVLTEMQAPQPGSPRFAVVAGTTDSVKGDTAEFTVSRSNDDGKLQGWFDKVYDVYNTVGEHLPNTGTPTNADSKVQ